MSDNIFNVDVTFEIVLRKYEILKKNDSLRKCAKKALKLSRVVANDILNHKMHIKIINFRYSFAYLLSLLILYSVD